MLAMAQLHDPQVHPPPPGAPKRIWAMSDLHTDCPENLKFVEKVDPLAHREDTLLVAGDVSDDVNVVRHTLRCLRAKFAAVFYTAGNHELWVVRQKLQKDLDSLKKLKQLDEMCAQEGIETR